MSNRKFDVVRIPPAQPVAEITLVFSLDEFQGLVAVVDGKGMMRGAWEPINGAIKELRRQGFSVDYPYPTY